MRYSAGISRHFKTFDPSMARLCLHAVAELAPSLVGGPRGRGVRRRIELPLAVGRVGRVQPPALVITERRSLRRAGRRCCGRRAAERLRQGDREVHAGRSVLCTMRGWRVAVVVGIYLYAASEQSSPYAIPTSGNATACAATHDTQNPGGSAGETEGAHSRAPKPPAGVVCLRYRYRRRWVVVFVAGLHCACV